MSTESANSSLVMSYLGLRRAIGLIAISLPFILIFGKIALESPGIQPSISDYYYSIMRNVFVGSLCAIGMFLMSYRGYDQRDAITGNLACVFVIGVALFPTTPLTEVVSFTDQIIGYVHYFFATAFFLTLAYFSLVLFRKTNPTKTMTLQKIHRNRVYAVCGYIILACIVLLLLNTLFLRDTWLANYDPVFWLETFAIIAFGISWLTKGDAFLKDTQYSTLEENSL